MKQTMRSLLKVFCLLLILMSCANTGESPENTPYEPINFDLKTASVIESSNNFGFELCKLLLQGVESNENVLISAMSVSQALCMARNGANGQTKNEITEVLAFDETLEGDINISQKKITEALGRADNQVDINVANSIWYRNDFSIIPEFIQNNVEYYNAEVSALDFSLSEEAKRIINNWVDNKTEGKIQEIVDEVTPDHVMFLINAIYFYGEWKNRFDKGDTQQLLFNKENGTDVKCDMMHQTATFSVYQDENLQMIELPYGNGHFNMVVLLPAEGNNVENIISSLDEDLWSEWINKLVSREVSLFLPKFKFECEYELKDYLKEMGMPSAFSGAADFSGITQDASITISKVKHKTFIEVDEKGTEAAAVTSVEMELTSMPNEYVFNANKPFVFAIFEKDTNTILFLGKLMNP
ncbi:serpin family protein [Plebeiibacterium marinum]|uniref:Serpin family protein n=1 Tax=Plebeiibacterium marinum TaxID=2992111 RepID=A0AAE3SM79_9BACT|nr:serpin family protein [Plebeiobacterium marinum]MCW3807265.1 serpin family protein [Plebeiobacterium marinum]